MSAVVLAYVGFLTAYLVWSLLLPVLVAAARAIALQHAVQRIVYLEQQIAQVTAKRAALWTVGDPRHSGQRAAAVPAFPAAGVSGPASELMPWHRCGLCGGPFTHAVHVSVPLVKNAYEGRILTEQMEEWCSACATLQPLRVDRPIIPPSRQEAP